VDRFPLNRRAWVVQERLLSNRTLQFTRSEIFWHCRQSTASETVWDLEGAGFHIGNYSSEEVFGYMDMILGRIELDGMGSSASQALYSAWAALVGIYSGCGLTRESDKLVALWGIVEKMERLVGDECVAGHWKKHLPQSLCWSTNWRPSSRPRRWRAPT
jgi:hypothetical protein